MTPFFAAVTFLAVAIVIVVVVAPFGTGLIHAGAVSHSIPAAPRYSVTFLESGLPSDTNWSVTLGGVASFSQGASISFLEASGNYSYQIGAVTGFFPSSSSGTVDVVASDVNESVHFAVRPPYEYPVTFTETGLTPGTLWNVTLNGVPENGTTSEISFEETNGTWNFSASAGTSYLPTSSSGSITVAGAPVSRSLPFSRILYLSIGGSSSVYPFDAEAVSQFEQNYTNVSITDSQGGSGAGLTAVCAATLDIGVSSTLETVSALQTDYGCPASAVINTVAYDAVDVIVPTSNVHQLGSISWDTLAYLYDGTSAGNATLLSPSIDGVSVNSSFLDQAPWSTHAALEWQQIPACVLNATTCGGVTGADLPEVLAAGVGAGAPCAGNPDLVCTANGTPASDSPCGFTICAGGSAGYPSTDLVETVSDASASSATGTFTARLLAATSPTTFATSVATLGFTGCGTLLLSGCGIASSLTAVGDSGVIAAVAGSPDSIGYAAFGPVNASGSEVSPVAFLGPGQVAGIGSAYVNGGIHPTLGASGTLEGGIDANSSGYVGWRPFEYVTASIPSGAAEEFIEFVLAPTNNQDLATETNEISVYEV